MRFARILRGPTRMPISFMSSEVNSSKASPSTCCWSNVSATPGFFGNMACTQSRTCKQRGPEAQARDMQSASSTPNCRICSAVFCSHWACANGHSLNNAAVREASRTARLIQACFGLAGARQSYQAQIRKKTSSTTVPRPLCVPRHPRAYWRMPDKLKLQ